MKTPLKIGFFGTPGLASCVLETLLASEDVRIVFVVTNPDKPQGRSSTPEPSPVKKLAEKNNLPVFTPDKILGNEQLLKTFRSFFCDYFIVCAYGKILPQSLLDVPKKMCINIHGSLLPKYRGASPIQSALLAGEPFTGVTIMRMNDKMDEGDLLSTQNIMIDPDETSATLFEKFEHISGNVLLAALKKLEGGELKPVPQDASQATYCKKIKKEDGLVDWKSDAKVLYQRWQALSPWPGLYTFFYSKRLLLEKISYTLIEHVVNEKNSALQPPGCVSILPSGEIGIRCQRGYILVHTLKIEGKPAGSIQDFVRGYPHFIGAILS